MNCPLCGSEKTTLLAEIKKRPEVEVDYKITEELYYRRIFQCMQCSVYFNSHSLIDYMTFYEGHYNNSISPLQSIEARFNRIKVIPFEKSDNKQRVARIIKKMTELRSLIQVPTVMDIGSGTCVFLYELLKKWKVNAFCIDPDPNSIIHVEKNIPEVHATNAVLKDLNENQKFDLITFNKVLEHVPNPIEQLVMAKKLLHESGYIYVELPYGEDIANEKAFIHNAEFNVEHITIYNTKSVAYLAEQAGFNPIEIVPLRDPSGKHTIYSFLEKQ